MVLYDAQLVQGHMVPVHREREEVSPPPEAVGQQVGLLIVRKAAKLVRYFLSPQENRFVTSCPLKS